MPPKKKPQSREEILERKRKRERERYARIKNDPVRLAAYKEKDKKKYLKGKATGVIKTINEMTDREKRKCRKSWKARSSRYYKKKCAAKKAIEDFIRANTPSSKCEEDLIRNLPSPPIHSLCSHPVQDQSATQSPRLLIAKQKSIIQRRKRNKEIKEKDKVIQELKSKLNKYRKKVSKLKKQKEKLKVLTPNSKMSQMAENPETRPEVVKKALFGDSIEQQISKNISKLKTNQEKEAANKLLLGPVVKKRKVWKTGTKVITYKKIWKMEKKKTQTKKSKRSLRRLVQEFLEDDKYSRIGAGKKEFIKRNKIRKQKRYRLDTLRNLHKEFLKTTNVVISYSMFTRLTPFWIVPAKVTDRDTCMCTLHSNIQLVTTALNKAKVLEVSSYQNLLTTVCCDRYNERCLERTCDSCYEKSLPLFDFEEAMPVKYQMWESKRETITDIRTKKNRTVIKQKKITLETSAGDLVQKLKKDLVTLFKHERNIVHQYQSIKMLKKSLSEKDAIVHMDFSENYACKYSGEIQSFHFGGSRIQISLHTVVVYLQNSSRSYCTVSTNLSHNVSAIWAHLKPVLEELPHNIENIHFLSDGPVTQYRNKLMFYILACKTPEMWPKFTYWTWNYHEAGHGKGAPDGVGASCKRSADHVVAMGYDVANLTQFCSAVQNRCPNITLFIVTDAEIEEMENLISSNQPNLLPFKGTLQIHQVRGNAYSSLKLAMKTLSCFCSNECEHFQMGIIKYSSTMKANIEDVFSESEGERSNAGSTSILKSSDMVDITSALGLITDDLNGLLEGPGIDIDTNDLFPVEEKRRGKKRKTNENDILIERDTNCRKSTKRSGDGKKNNLNGKKRTKLKSNKLVRRKVKKWKENESDDCSCLICGVLYKEDTTGQDWIQCIMCHLWAQINCIKSGTDLTSYTCSKCLPDGDFDRLETF